jgi:hypothetical protein
MLNELHVLQHGSTGPVDEEEAELARWRTTVVHGNRTTSRELDLLDRQAILDRLHDVVHLALRGCWFLLKARLIRQVSCFGNRRFVKKAKKG